MDIFLASLATGAAVGNEMARQSQRITQADQEANLLRTDVTCLRDEVERLALLNQALWELIKARLKLTDADLEKVAQQVDLRDGMADGKMSKHPLRCPKCGRVSNSRHKKCLYCGLLFEGDIFG